MIIDSLISKTDKRTSYGNVSYSSQTHSNLSHSISHQYGSLGDKIQHKNSDCGCNETSEILSINDNENIVKQDTNITNSVPRPVPINEYSPQLSNMMFEKTMHDKRDIPFPITE